MTACDKNRIVINLQVSSSSFERDLYSTVPVWCREGVQYCTSTATFFRRMDLFFYFTYNINKESGWIGCLLTYSMMMDVSAGTPRLRTPFSAQIRYAVLNNSYLTRGRSFPFGIQIASLRLEAKSITDIDGGLLCALAAAHE